MKHFMFAFFVFLFVRLMTSSVCNKEFEETFCENYTFYPNLTLNSAATHRVTIRNAKDDLQMENNALIDALELQALTLNNTIFPPRLEGLDSVKSLTVQHSNYTIIEKDLFIHLKSLKFLDLQYNKIRTIVPGSFEQLSQLKVLNLADNELDLTWNEFDGLKSLKVLFLERNKFTKVNVTKLVASLPNLERIFFSPDQLETKNRKEIEDIFPKLNITFIYGFSK
nr:PREDICTED: SLIT and NTRK-like protein 6 [Tribolium castaneum]|eukprot:XP_008194454.1 PREDICTED: SLIT and NTRK-like protein 6 [Tribolium castaneum]